MTTKVKIGPIQERDACLALVFLILLIWLFWHESMLVYLAMCALLVGMIWPKAMHPVAVGWFALAGVMGNVMNKVLLGIVWLCMVVPVGFTRRKMGKDAMRMGQWRDGRDSAFVVRDHKYSPDDMKNPY